MHLRRRRHRPANPGTTLVILATALLAAALTGCSPVDESGSQPAPSTAGGTNACAKPTLHLVKAGRLTIGTDKPAYEPWFSNNDPANGKGFESAVAYAVADQLGFAKSEVTWATVPFNSSYAPGRKTFDFDINQISITDDRKKAVDFSTGYYTVSQAVVALKSSKIAGAKTVAELAGAKLGAQVGTTSLDAIKSVIKPSQQPAVFNDTNDAKSQLQNKVIDGIVVDLPTAFFLTAAEIEDSTIVGQLPAGGGTPEQFGLLFEKGNPLVSCVNTALGALTTAGDLAKITDQYLAASAGAPKLG
ncbi:MAG TPA: ABC transporter substrate-binding protein [Mycobacteriales bacterium]|nr:ABC transporter substrate-binding protein [Mycobacteriales bacterium]